MLGRMTTEWLVAVRSRKRRGGLMVGGVMSGSELEVRRCEELEGLGSVAAAERD